MSGKSPNDSDDLSPMLKAWRVDVSVPAGFQREVWHRIAARQSEREESRWRRVGTWLERIVMRPAVAVAIVLSGMGIGVMIARDKAQVESTAYWRGLEERYANSVNPAGRHVDHMNDLAPFVE